MKWKPATINGQIYDLAHLHPFFLELKLDAYKTLPALTLDIEVIFGLHCFTEDLHNGCVAQHHYADSRV